MKKSILIWTIMLAVALNVGCNNSELMQNGSELMQNSSELMQNSVNKTQEDIKQDTILQENTSSDDTNKNDDIQMEVVDEIDKVADEFGGIQGVTTEEDRLVILFVEALHAGDYIEALSYVDTKDSVFYDRLDLKDYVQINTDLAYLQQNYEIIQSIKTHELDNTNKKVTLQVEGDTYNIYVTHDSKGILKINLGHEDIANKFCKENFKLEVPKDSTVFIRGVQLDESYRQQGSDDIDYYIIDSLPAVDMEIHLITEFKEDRVTVNPSKTDSRYRLVVTLTDDEINSVRKRAFNTLNEIMTKLNEGMSLEEFKRYFTEDVSIAEIEEIYSETKDLMNKGIMRNARFASIDEPILSNDACDFYVRTANEAFMNIQLDKRFTSNDSEIEQTKRTDYEIAFKFGDENNLISEIGIIDPFSNIV